MSQELARRFFDEFVEAFACFDGALVAQRYLSPYLAFHSPEELRVFASAADIAVYFQGILDDYRARGCRACRYRDLHVTALGADCALASVTWELLDAAGGVIAAWRESYNLCRVEGRYRVFASTDHR
ncbi:hypothetical protein AAFN46_02815 [Pseudomonas sp. CAU 1711]|uniref:hypothetical protein n=1 Tax=Pseudomonas sp. CAU 1711 TaxID=3140356 RepID=UPI003261BC71